LRDHLGISKYFGDSGLSQLAIPDPVSGIPFAMQLKTTDIVKDGMIPIALYRFCNCV